MRIVVALGAGLSDPFSGLVLLCSVGRARHTTNLITQPFNQLACKPRNYLLALPLYRKQRCSEAALALYLTSYSLCLDTNYW